MATSFKGKHTPAIGPNMPTPGYLLKRKETQCPQENLYVTIYSSFIHNSSPKGETTRVLQQVNGWTNCHPSVQRNTAQQWEGALLLPAPRMTLKWAGLRERAQTHKAAGCALSFTGHSGKSNLTAENRSVIPRGWGWRRKLMTEGCKGVFRVMGKFYSSTAAALT